VRRLAAVDAQTYWMSAHVPNDQFLLYAFAAAPDRLNQVLDGLARRAAACADLRLRLSDDHPWRYPRWESAAVTPEQFVVHEPLAWDDCLPAVAALAEDQLDPRAAAWRLHLFGSVVVLQLAHCLADGTRSADLAAWLFGRDVPVPPLPQTRRGSLVLRSVTAARTHRAMVADIAAGRLPPPRPSQPPGPTNSAPAGRRQVRTLLRRRSELGEGRTVTVAVLAAIGDALDGYLRAHGCAAPLTAEVLLAKPGIRLAGNHFRNTGVGLYPELAPGQRAAAIDADLRAGRQRAQHPAALAAERAFAATPRTAGDRRDRRLQRQPRTGGPAARDGAGALDVGVSRTVTDDGSHPRRARDRRHHRRQRAWRGVRGRYRRLRRPPGAGAGLGRALGQAERSAAIPTSSASCR
jgi:hypothetical protein